MAVYTVRIKCTNPSDPSDWHYYREDQTVIDDTITDPAFPTYIVTDFDIESTDET